jgi:predicted PurR-regulated permease PerM
VDSPVMTSENAKPALIVSKRSAHILFLLAIVIIGWSGLGPLLLAVLFSYFTLDILKFLRRKWLTVAVFVALVCFIGWGLVMVIDHAIKTFPQAVMAAIPKMTALAEKHGWTLPFSDWATARIYALDTIRGELRSIGTFTRIAAKDFAFLLIGIVIAISMYLNPSTDLDRHVHKIKRNLYTVFTDHIADCFRSFYQSFKTVMEAQLIISTINTGLTAIFLTIVHMPHSVTLVVITFLCGLLPIIGNLLSNSAIVMIGFTVSPELGISALVYLIVLHKLEYFLNSKIIGDRIKNPVWLTLIGLVVGEKLMGITGMILAPVILYYLKQEGSKIPVAPPTPATQRDIAG